MNVPLVYTFDQIHIFEKKFTKVYLSLASVYININNQNQFALIMFLIEKVI